MLHGETIFNQVYPCSHATWGEWQWYIGGFSSCLSVRLVALVVLGHMYFKITCVNEAFLTYQTAMRLFGFMHPLMCVEVGNLLKLLPTDVTPINV